MNFETLFQGISKTSKEISTATRTTGRRPDDQYTHTNTDMVNCKQIACHSFSRYFKLSKIKSKKLDTQC